MKNEKQIELSFIEKLKELKYIYREDIKDKASLEENFRRHFQELNRVRLSDSEFGRLKESIITPDVFSAAKILRETNTFKRDDDTPLQYTLVNTNDWCKNEYEVINQLRINTENSHHRYDVIILINGIPVVQVELKSLQITPKRAMEQIVDYKNDPGNGYTNSLLCFMQLFIVSNESNTYYFANNNKEHFAFDTDERFLPVYQFADKDNKKITHLHDFSEAVLRKCALGELISKYMVLVASEQKSSLMNAIVHSLEKTTKQSKTFSQKLSCLGLLARLFLKRTQLTSKLMELSVLIPPQRIFLRKSCTHIRSPMRLMIEMYCDSTLII